jgi:hypothetical protein
MIKLFAALLSSSLGALALLAVVTVHCGQPDVPDAPTVEPDPIVVIVPVPELLSPLDNAEVSLTPSLLTSIIEGEDAITQHLEVSLNGAVVFQDVIEQGVPLTVSGLDYGNVYSWRAKAIAGDLESAWSDSRTFLTPVWVVDINSLDELCEFAATLPFSALIEPSNPVPYRDAIIAGSNNPLVGLHHRPNGKISHDIVALNIPAQGQPHQIADVVVGSTGPNPSRGCIDQTATIEPGSVFLGVH